MLRFLDNAKDIRKAIQDEFTNDYARGILAHTNLKEYYRANQYTFDLNVRIESNEFVVFENPVTKDWIEITKNRYDVPQYNIYASNEGVWQTYSALDALDLMQMLTCQVIRYRNYGWYNTVADYKDSLV